MRLILIVFGLALFALGIYYFTNGPVFANWFSTVESKSPPTWMELALEIIKLLVAFAGLGTAYYNFRNAKSKAD